MRKFNQEAERVKLSLFMNFGESCRALGISLYELNEVYKLLKDSNVISEALEEIKSCDFLLLLERVGVKTAKDRSGFFEERYLFEYIEEVEPLFLDSESFRKATCNATELFIKAYAKVKREKLYEKNI